MNWHAPGRSWLLGVFPTVPHTIRRYFLEDTVTVVVAPTVTYPRRYSKRDRFGVKEGDNLMK
jgi:hypothetical protein